MTYPLSEIRRWPQGAQNHIISLGNRLAEAEQENVALRAKVAKLEAPVSDYEWDKEAYRTSDPEDEYMLRKDVDALIAARGREGE